MAHTKATRVSAVHEALLSFAVWTKSGLKPSIQNVVELKRATPSDIQNPILVFVVPRAMNYVVERFVLEVVQAWELLNSELKRLGLRTLGVSHKDYRHLKKIRNKLVAHKIENSLKTKRYESWYRRTYGSYEAILALVERAAERITARIERLELSGHLYAKNTSARITQVFNQQDIQALLDALKKQHIY